jgi:hypothetical protein
MKKRNFIKYISLIKGAPPVCTVCYKNNHIKSDCPELSVPNKIALPVICTEWIDLLSHLCRYITGMFIVVSYLNIFMSLCLCFVDQYKATKNDVKKREEILNDLQVKFEKSYPTCSVHAYESSHNGFGLRQSDLDVCVLLKDNVCFSFFYSITIFDRIFYSRTKNLILLFWNIYSEQWNRILTCIHMLI